MGPPRPIGPRGYRIRRATVSDVETLVDHRHRMLVETGLGSVVAVLRHDAEYRRWLRPRLRRGEYVGVLAERAGAPVASGGLWWRQEIPRPHYGVEGSPYLASMYTEPGSRGRGLATRIVRALLAEARARRANRVTLHASVMGYPIYRRLGFERTREMRYYLDPRYVRALRARRRASARARARARASLRRSAPARSGRGRPRSRSRRPGRSGPTGRS
jgi:GNAT superfamily N-acetyltransferase